MPNRAEFPIVPAASMSPAQGEAVLKRRGWLSDREPEFQDALLKACRWRLFQQGETLVMAGDIGAPLIGIAAGNASVITSIGAPDTPLTHISHPASWLGYVPLVANRPTDNTTIARTPVYAAVIAKSAVEALLNEHPGWWRHIARLALQYGEIAAGIVADLLIRESDRRCAATLLRLADCRFAGARPAKASVNQSDLAVVANLSRTTASALLGRFEAMGLIARGYNYIEVLDPPALRAIADGELQSNEPR